MQILDDNGTNYLILTDDGTTETRSKASDLNKLLYGHNLHGLLEENTEIWTHSGADDEPSVTVVPLGDDEYSLEISNAPPLHLGAHHKTDLVDALAEMYEDHNGESVEPLVNLYDGIREDMIRHEALDAFYELLSEKVEKRDDGWFINGHLLLTYENEFYHSENRSRNRSGSVIGQGMSIEAYNLDFEEPESNVSRNVTVDGKDYRLTNREMEFLGRAVWAVKNTPDRR